MRFLAHPAGSEVGAQAPGRRPLFTFGAAPLITYRFARLSLPGAVRVP